MKKFLCTTLMLCGIISVISCGGNKKDTSTTEENSQVEETPVLEEVTTITVDDLTGKEFILTSLYPEKNITLVFNDTNMIGGKSAVNSYFSEYALEGNKLILKAVGATKMAGPEEDMKAEAEYFQLLNDVDTITLNGDVLTITTKSGTNLVFNYNQNVETTTDNN